MHWPVWLYAATYWGKRLGIDFQALDEAIMAKLTQNIKNEYEAEKWYGDLSEYQRHLRGKR